MFYDPFYLPLPRKELRLSLGPLEKGDRELLSTLAMLERSLKLLLVLLKFSKE